MACFILLFLALFAPIWSIDEEAVKRRLYAHLTLEDYATALQECEALVETHAQWICLHEVRLRALARSGKEKEAVLAWKKYAALFPDNRLKSDLIEELAWGVLQKASLSSSLVMRNLSLLAAFFSQDARGVLILRRAMKDPNYAIREVAVKLSSHFRDGCLIEEVKRLFREEKMWAVKKEVIAAAGKMKIVALKEELTQLVAKQESRPEEKAVATCALLELLSELPSREVQALAMNNRAGLRELACRSIAHFQSDREVETLLFLTKDPDPKVRLAAFQSIGQLHPQEEKAFNNLRKKDEADKKERKLDEAMQRVSAESNRLLRPPSASASKVIEAARQGVQDCDYRVALSAAWVLTLYRPEEGAHYLKWFLQVERYEVRLLAAAALAASGPYAQATLIEQFHKTSDPFIKLNLAFGLIGQRVVTDEASTCLMELLMQEEGARWSRLQVGIFSVITEKKIERDESFNREVEHLELKLELLHLLAILKGSNVEAAIKKYLASHTFEVSAAAATVLLTEQDENLADALEILLEDSSSRIKLHAALILSLWSQNEKALKVLEEQYRACDFEMKARILEAMGRIGSLGSIPFLIDILQEPSQTLRLISVMAIIQCLNH